MDLRMSMLCFARGKYRLLLSCIRPRCVVRRTLHASLMPRPTSFLADQFPLPYSPRETCSRHFTGASRAGELIDQARTLIGENTAK